MPLKHFINNFRIFITEKLYIPLKQFVIPVVYGSKEVHKIAPPHSYIDVRDFKSTKLLAEYLLYLDKNDTAYMDYFQWKKNYRVEFGHRTSTAVFCHFCKYLHIVNKPKLLHSYSQWFFKQSQCKDPHKEGLL